MLFKKENGSLDLDLFCSIAYFIGLDITNIIFNKAKPQNAQSIINKTNPLVLLIMTLLNLNVLVLFVSRPSSRIILLLWKIEVSMSKDMLLRDLMVT